LYSLLPVQETWKPSSNKHLIRHLILQNREAIGYHNAGMHQSMAWFLLVIQIVLLSIPEAAEGQRIAKPGCQEKCGAVDIPYPFGIGSNCFLDIGAFEITCNITAGGMVPFSGDLEVMNITLSTAQARMYNYISWQCYNGSDNSLYYSSRWLNLGSAYTLSNLHNRYTVIGCQTLAFNEMWDYNGVPYRTGCVSTCYNQESLTNGSCSGNGCCQTAIPSGINFYNTSFDKYYNSSQVWDFSKCSYAVIMATDSFYFSTSYISTIDFWSAHNGTVPVVLDWSIGKETCNVAKDNLSSYACVSNNSVCFNSTNNAGYYCNCLSGYQGNPYLSDGCQGQAFSLKCSLFPFDLLPVYYCYRYFLMYFFLCRH
jgi:Wall-associated receptor kinase galacturonan-binding